jgi:MFS family permease
VQNFQYIPINSKASLMSNKNNINIFALIVLFISIAPMAAEIYIPSLPYISQDLHTTKNMVQLTITCFLFGMATTGILFGYISDYFGRRPILISTSIIFFRFFFF